MNELETIGQLYIDWLKAHRAEYRYFNQYLQAITTENKDIYGNYTQELDHSPPDYNSKDWGQLAQLKQQAHQSAKVLYTQLLEKADLYLANEVLT